MIEKDRVWVEGQLRKVRAAYPALPPSEDKIPFNAEYFDTTMPLQPDSAFIDEMFANHGPSQYIPQHLRDQAVRIMRTTYDHTQPTKSAPEAERTRRMVERKVHHTKGVVQSTWEIMRGTRGINWNISQAETIAMWHDPARFAQALLTSTFADHRSFFHAPHSAQMLRQVEFPFAAHGLDEAVIMQAIERHGLLDPGTNDPYALLIRDADKLDLLRISTKLLEDSKTYINGGQGVSKNVRDAYLDGRMALNGDRKTEADGVLSRMCWLYDINFPQTQRIIRSEGLADTLFQQYTKLVGYHDTPVYRATERWKRSLRTNPVNAR